MARLRDSWPPTLIASTQKGYPRCPSHLLGNRMIGAQFGKRPLATVRRIFGSILLWLAVTGMIEPTLQRKSVALAFIRVSGGETEIDKRPNRR